MCRVVRNVYYEKSVTYITNNYFSIITQKLKSPVDNVSNTETLSDKLFKDLDDYNKYIYNTGQGMGTKAMFRNINKNRNR